MSHRDAIRELEEAVPIAHELLGAVEAVGVEPGWRVEESDPFRILDHLAGMMIEFGPDELAPPPFVWSRVGGVKPKLLDATVTVGLDGRLVLGSFWLKVEDEASFSAMVGVFDELTRLDVGRNDRAVDHLTLTLGPWFSLQVDEGLEGGPLPIPIGWLNFIRADPSALDDVELPDWVEVERHERHIELRLGTDPGTLVPSQARDVRDRLVSAGVLRDNRLR